MPPNSLKVHKKLSKPKNKWTALSLCRFSDLQFQFLFAFMVKRQSWTKEEDNLIKVLILERQQEKKKICWAQVSQNLKLKNPNWKRTGKQCRQRWLNHLNPSLNSMENQQSMDLDFLFNLIRVYGKKWTLIAKQMPNRTDNSIKNFFYASLRKGLRNLNIYNTEIRSQRRYKCYDKQLIDKILSVHDEKKKNDLFIFDNQVFSLTEQIRQSLIRCYQDDFRNNSVKTNHFESFYQKLNDNIVKFCRICKFKKSKGCKNKTENEKFEVFHRKQLKKVMKDDQKTLTGSTQLKIIKSFQENFSDFSDLIDTGSQNILPQQQQNQLQFIAFESSHDLHFVKEQQNISSTERDIKKQNGDLFESLTFPGSKYQELISLIF